MSLCGKIHQQMVLGGWILVGDDDELADLVTLAAFGKTMG